MANRALVFDLVGRDRGLGRTLNQTAHGIRGLGQATVQVTREVQQATERLQVGVERAQFRLRQAEIAAESARAKHARAVELFGADSKAAERAAIKVEDTQLRVREATIRAADAQEKLTDSTHRGQQVTARASTQWEHGSSKLGNLAKHAKLAAAALISVGVAGAVRAAKGAVQAAADFDQTMRQFAAVADLPQEQLGEMRKLALDMGAATSFSASQAGQAMLDLAKGGLTAAQIKGGALQSTLVLAAAGGIELANAGDTLANALNMFGMRAEQSGQVAAALAGAANASTASVEQLTQALAQVGPGARNAGLDLNDTVGVLAAFHQAGFKGSDAGTSLKTMLVNLVPQTKKARVEMQRLGLDFTDAHGNILPIIEIAEQLHTKLRGLSQEELTPALATIFGPDATRAATVLMNEGAAGIRKYIEATKDRAAAEKLARANTEGAAGAFEQLKGAMETISIRVGDPLLKPLAAGARTMADELSTAMDRIAVGAERFWERIEPVRNAISEVFGAFRGAREEFLGGLADAFKAIAPSAESTDEAVSGAARAVRLFKTGLVEAYHWATDTGIPTVLQIADAYVNRFVRPVGKAVLTLSDMMVRAMSTGARGAINALEFLAKGAAKAFGWIPGIGDDIRSAASDLEFFADASRDSLDTFTDAVGGARRVGTRMLDELGESLDGSADRYREFRREAQQKVMVEVHANISDLTAKLKTGELTVQDFRSKANREVARISSRPARLQMTQLIEDLADGKISVAQFRKSWNTEMGKLKDAQRTASVNARIGRPDLLQQDLNRARRLLGLSPAEWRAAEGWGGSPVRRATGGPVFGPGTPTSDSILARLSHGEHVWSAREVAAAGGHEQLVRMRELARQGRLPRFATGGRVDLPPGYPQRISGNAFTVNHYLTRMSDQQRFRYAALYGLPPAPRGWTWAEDHTLVPTAAWLAWRRRTGGLARHAATLKLHLRRGGRFFEDFSWRGQPRGYNSDVVLRAFSSSYPGVDTTTPKGRQILMRWLDMLIPPAPMTLLPHAMVLRSHLVRGGRIFEDFSWRGQPRGYNSDVLVRAFHRAHPGVDLGGPRSRALILRWLDLLLPGFARGGPVLRVATSGLGQLGNRLAAQTLAGDALAGDAARLLAVHAGQQLLREWGDLGSGTGPGGWRWQMSVLRRVFPGLPLISGLRPGAVTVTGRRSFHALGRAVDVPPRMEVFNFIRGRYGKNTEELIFTPAGRRQVKDGRPHVYTGAVARMHHNHIHWAYDQGGWLPPGLTLAYNGTGRPERVLPPQGSMASVAADIDRLVNALVAQLAPAIGREVSRQVAAALATTPPRPILLDRRKVGEELAHYAMQRQRG